MFRKIIQFVLLTAFTCAPTFAINPVVNHTSTITPNMCNNGTEQAPYAICPSGWVLGALGSGGPAGLKAFPGAEGYGEDAVGGRGGQVIKVTNLDDSGAGSFRAAVTASGPRIVVFDVSGIINLTTDLIILNPFITIAGQTSPAGILIAGRPTIIETSDVIVRHMSFRTGSHNIINSNDAESSDSLIVWGPTWSESGNTINNIVIDHCSVGWGADENMSIVGGATVTVSWSLFHQGLANTVHPEGNHSYGLLVNSRESINPTYVSLHHNYFAHNWGRNPQISTTQTGITRADVRNNVLYNQRSGLVAHSENTAEVNWVHNYQRNGVNANGRDNTKAVALIAPSGAPYPLLHVVGNLSEFRTSQAMADWDVQNDWQSDVLVSQAWERVLPWDTPTVNHTTMSDAYALTVVQGAGATVPARNSVDLQAVNDFINETGNYVDNVSYPASYPTIANPTPPSDSDNDGMADAWETSRGTNVGSNDSATVASGQVYTNIERYINELADGTWSN